MRTPFLQETEPGHFGFVVSPFAELLAGGAAATRWLPDSKNLAEFIVTNVGGPYAGVPELTLLHLQRRVLNITPSTAKQVGVCSLLLALVWGALDRRHDLGRPA